MSIRTLAYTQQSSTPHLLVLLVAYWGVCHAHLLPHIWTMLCSCFPTPSTTSLGPTRLRIRPFLLNSTVVLCVSQML